VYVCVKCTLKFAQYTRQPSLEVERTTLAHTTLQIAGKKFVLWPWTLSTTYDLNLRTWPG